MILESAAFDPGKGQTDVNLICELEAVRGDPLRRRWKCQIVHIYVYVLCIYICVQRTLEYSMHTAGSSEMSLSVRFGVEFWRSVADWLPVRLSSVCPPERGCVSSLYELYIFI